MNTFTLHIKDSNKRVLALLNLIRETEEIVLEENTYEFELSDTHKRILDQRKADHLAGVSKSYSWSEVKERARATK